MNRNKYLRLFLAPDDGVTAGGETATTTEQTNNNPTGGTEPEKMFSQSELNRLLANEKKQGRSAILKELGFADAATAKKTLEDLKSYQDSQKTLEQKYADLQKEAETLKSAQNAELAVMSIKLDAVKMGVNPDALDDFAAIAVSKIDDKNDLQTVIKGMQKNPIYSGFFSSTAATEKGTGGSPSAGGGKATPSNENIGERLAKARAASNQKSNPYFK